MTPQPVRTALPLPVLRAPLRMIIGGTPGLRRRLPVPLFWRARRGAAATAAVPAPPVAGRIDHFHHWSMSAGIDWRIGTTTTLRTTTEPLLFRRAPDVTPGAPHRLRPPAADLQLRRSRHTILEARSSETHAVTDRRTILDRVTAHNRSERHLSSDRAVFHQTILRHWRTIVQPDGDRTTILAASPRRHRAVAPETAAPRRQSTPARLVWPSQPSRLIHHAASAPAQAPAPYRADSPIHSMPALRRAARPVALVWRKPSASPAPNAVPIASAMRTVRETAAVQQVTWAERTTSPVTLRSSVSVTPSNGQSAPDMNRLVDEVVRRIDRQARSERQRRGL